MAIVTEVSPSAWGDFCHSHPNTPIFQTPEMYAVYEKTTGLAPDAVFELTDGEMTGCLLSVRQVWAANRVVSLFARSLILSGPIGDGATQRTLLRHHQLRANHASIFSEIRPFIPDEALKAAAVSCGFRWEPHLNYLVDLLQGEQVLWNSMSKSRRKNIRSAERAGLHLRFVDGNESVLRLSELVQSTYARAGIPPPDQTLFQAAHEVLGACGRWIAVLAEHEGRPVAGRAVLVSDGFMHDWYAGSTDHGRELHADEWLVWELLKQGVADSVRTFDFGGAGSVGEYGPGEFKRRFGGRSVSPGRMIVVHRPIEYLIARTAWKALNRVRRG